MCPVGRAEYEEYIRGVIGDEAFEHIEQQREAARKRMAEEDAQHPEWTPVHPTPYGMIWRHSDGHEVGVGVTGRPWKGQW